MKLHLIPALLGMSAMASVALAAPVETVKEQQQPVRISNQQMDKVTAGQGQAMTTVITNPAGQGSPVGQGQALTTTVLNPAGQAPPGQN